MREEQRGCGGVLFEEIYKENRRLYCPQSNANEKKRLLFSTTVS